MFRNRNGGFNKVFNAMAFKINIPKGATVTKASFECTIGETGLPEYTAKFGFVHPSESLKFLQTCEYKSISKLASTSVSWNLSSIHPHIKVGAILSMAELQVLLQEFVNDDAYTPGTYFQLVIFEESFQKRMSVQNFFKCYAFREDEWRPLLQVEWL